MKYVKHLTLPILATLVVVAGSVLSAQRAKVLFDFDFFSRDKVIHFLCYFVLTLLWSYGLDKISKSRPIIWALVITIVLGVSMEVLQYTLIEGRYFEFLDIIANISGSLVGALAFIRFIK